VSVSIKASGTGSLLVRGLANAKRFTAPTACTVLDTSPTIFESFEIQGQIQDSSEDYQNIFLRYKFLGMTNFLVQMFSHRLCAT